VTTYPLPTLSAVVTSTGISAPSYSDILLSLQASYRAIYGADVDLDPDTQDGNWLAIQAAAINDANQVAISTYLSFSPSSAQGAALSSVVKVNGITRMVASASSTPVLIVGQAGSIINNGAIGDNVGLNTRWNLPTSVTIPPGGSITVTATCAVVGATTAAANTLTKILTPTYGWQTVNNPSAAAVGAPVETDAQLRQRQTTSTTLPSETVLAGITGAIANLTGVTDVVPYENDTGTTDGNGVPGHSIAMVVEGGAVQDIVNVIGSRKTLGCGTYGNTSGSFTDPTYGFVYPISYSVPTQKRVLVAISLTALTGYTSLVGVEIQTAVAAYVNSLGIGQNVRLSRLYAPALLQGPFAAPANPTDAETYEIPNGGITISFYPASPSTSDLTILFNQIATLVAADITLTVT
jgi:uncharacterized phage protein gp47/JayE